MVTETGSVPMAQLQEAIRLAKRKAENDYGVAWGRLEEISQFELVFDVLASLAPPSEPGALTSDEVQTVIHALRFLDGRSEAEQRLLVKLESTPPAPVSETGELLPVIQADRNAAADIEAITSPTFAETIRAGSCDEGRLVQAFARRARLATSALAPSVEQRLREASRWAEALACLPVRDLAVGKKPYVVLHALDRDALVDFLSAVAATLHGSGEDER